MIEATARILKDRIEIAVRDWLVINDVRDAETVGRDIIATTRAIAIAAVGRGETDRDALLARLSRVASGYLNNGLDGGAAGRN